MMYMSAGISGSAAPAEEVFRNPVLPKIRTGFLLLGHPNKIIPIIKSMICKITSNLNMLL